MRIGLASDSAGNIAVLCRAFRLLQDSLQCQRMFFLGGNWEDVDACQESTGEQPTVEQTTPAYGLLAVMQEALEHADSTEESTSPGLWLEGVIRVAERTAPQDLERKTFEMVGSSLCLLVHNKADLTKEDLLNAPLIFHGRSEKPGVVRIGTRTFITPGSLSAPPPSVAVVEMEGGGLDVRFFDLDGRLLDTHSVPMTSGTRFNIR